MTGHDRRSVRTGLAQNRRQDDAVRRLSKPVRVGRAIEQVDDDGQVHFVPVPADDPAAAVGRTLIRSGPRSGGPRAQLR